MRRLNFFVSLTLVLFSVSVINANVLGLWEMDESNGLNASDGSFNDNHGTLCGGLNFNAHSVVGKYGHALHFNGTSHYVNVSIADYRVLPGIRGTGNRFTVSLWVNVNSWDRNGIIISYKANQIEWTIGTSDTDNGKLVVGGCMPPYSIKRGLQTDASGFPTGQYVHICATFTDSSKGPQEVYVNGNLKASEADNAWAALDTRGLCVGARQRASTIPDMPFAGAVDDLALFAGILNSSRILEIYNSSTPVSDTLYRKAIKASQPKPADNAVYVNQSVVLRWKAGKAANSHQVYFGTDYNDIKNADNPRILPGRGNQADTSFKPGFLADNAVYYWRVDEVTDDTVIRGDVWSFTVSKYPAGLIMDHHVSDYLYLDPIPLARLKHAQKAGLLFMDPVILPEGDNIVSENDHFGFPVAAMIDDTIVVLFLRRPDHTGGNPKSGPCYIISDDAGCTWSEMIWLNPLTPCGNWQGTSGDWLESGSHYKPWLCGAWKGQQFSICATDEGNLIMNIAGTYISQDKGQTWYHFLHSKLGLSDDVANWGPSLVDHPVFGILGFNGEDSDPEIQYTYIRISENQGMSFSEVAWPTPLCRPVEPEAVAWGPGHLVIIPREFDRDFAARDGRYWVQSQHVYRYRDGDDVSDLDQMVTRRTNLRGNMWPGTGHVHEAGLSFNPVTNRIELDQSHRFGGGLGDTGENSEYDKSTLNLWSIDPDELLNGSSQWRFDGTILERNGYSGSGHLDGLHPGSPVIDEVRGLEHIFIYAGTRRKAGIFRLSRILDTTRLRHYLLNQYATIWHFESNVSIMDASGYAHNAEVTGFPESVSGAPEYGSTTALQFDAENDSVQYPQYGNIFFDLSDFTIEVIFKTRSHASGTDEGALVSKDHPSGAFWKLSVKDGLLRCTLSDGMKGASILSTSAVNDRRWHHVAVVRDTNEKHLQLYVDHVLHSIHRDITGDIQNPNAPLCIACSSDGQQQFVGAIDFVKITREAIHPRRFALPLSQQGDAGLQQR